MSESRLMDELAKERKNIKTDSYDMSIGEIISLYQEGDLKLNPAYQRLYRWDTDHKVRFIESILIGIPIPEIFVAQKEDGKWDIVDGVQRISTLLQLVGKLPGYEPLKLEGTKYLPSLSGMTWETMPNDAKRLLKRARIGVNIILTENSIESQYELFQRLNTGGVSLESQEIRNCLIIMLDASYYEKINTLKDYEHFKDCLTLSEDKYKVEYHMELIIRYLIAKRNKVNYKNYNPTTEKLTDFLDHETSLLIADEEFNIDEEIELFKTTFDLLAKKLGKDTFKKYNNEKKCFEGAFSNASYEAILVGVAENIEKLQSIDLKKCIEKMYDEEKFLTYSARGVRVINRFKSLNEFSREYFANAN
ncbi:hypothetical protein EUBC25_20210 [Claveliimonas bilis]|uniref:GmrSD restriction endonuclease domain-containing protein n=1 Tax=Claveliimonas bilis TaxID=3028070 RepID=UPI001E509ABB|nr:DUF262 domain-containing protein [Claveliimonas bilis]BCZ27934.1 hypothetical protein EUBC25_20210 [Claveliimonas bilis]